MTAAAATSSTPSPRDHLIKVALELVANEGIESVTLRRIARRAGVSHGAPLRHFESLADLLAEVAAEGFRLLSRAIEVASAATSPIRGSMPRLRAAGRAYVQVAVENPGLFTLMFRPDWLRGDNPRYVADAAEAFELLASQVQSAQDSGWQNDRDTRLLAGVIWSNVHGLASLWSQNALLGPVPNASLKEAVELSLDLVLPITNPQP